MKNEGNEMKEKDDWNEKEWARRMTKTVLINDEENEGKGKKKVQRKKKGVQRINERDRKEDGTMRGWREEKNKVV